MNWLESNPQNVEDEHLLELIGELEALVPVGRDQFTSLFLFLTQCVYYNGPGERIKLNPKQHAPLKGLLETKVISLVDTSIYEICGELAAQHFKSLEMYDNKQLYVFLNEFLPNYEKAERERKRRTGYKRFLR